MIHGSRDDVPLYEEESGDSKSALILETINNDTSGRGLADNYNTGFGRL